MLLMKVRGYPTIKYFPAGQKSEDSAEEYDGGRTASDIVNWALNKVAENIPPPEIVEVSTLFLFQWQHQFKFRTKIYCLENYTHLPLSMFASVL